MKVKLRNPDRVVDVSTPSDRGHFRFQRRQPGYNSLGMLDSVSYNRGEAKLSIGPASCRHGTGSLLLNRTFQTNLRNCICQFVEKTQ